MKNVEENCEIILKIWRKIEKRFGKYRRKESRIVKRYKKYGTNPS
jgi:hypothetical protein